MNFLNPAYALFLTGLAVTLVAASTYWSRPLQGGGRFDSIDGLRGYLAFFVFIHHASIWFTYLRTGSWHAPDSNLYTQLGEASVSLFFMITSFLFYNKLIECKNKEFDWGGFFTGRVFRLTPLYLVSMIILLGIIAILSDFHLKDSLKYIAKCLAQWASFTMFGDPAINQVNAKIIVAGVIWSLPYEWCFYLSLPLIALTTGRKVHPALLLVAAVALAYAVYSHMKFHLALVFVGGMIAAALVRSERFKRIANNPASSLMAVACLAGVNLFSTAYGLPQAILLTIAFCLIANGADLFGILITQTSRRFGELAYSIYLLHGIVLFVAFKFVIGGTAAKSLSPEVHWATVAVAVPVLLLVSALAYGFIEKPGIELGRQLRLRHRQRIAPMAV